MASRMKTTIHIADALLTEAQTIAAREKTTLKALVNEGLQKVIAERQTRKPFKLRDASFGGEGLNPEIKDLKWENIVSLVYGDRGS